MSKPNDSEDCGQSPRELVIDKNVSEIMHSMLDEAEDWLMPEGATLGPEPQWWEIRDAVQRWLFRMEHEFGKRDAESDHVRENCI